MEFMNTEWFKPYGSIQIEEFNVFIGVLDKCIRMGMVQFKKMKYMKY